VALNFLPPEKVNGSRTPAQVRTGSHSSIAFSHPGIVTIYDMGAALHLHQSLQTKALWRSPPFAVTPDKLYVLVAQVKGNAWAVKVDRP
jgi:hypothetical protein